MQVQGDRRRRRLRPRQLTNALVTRPARRRPTPRSGFLLDGYPRTLDQVRYLDAFLATPGARARRRHPSSVADRDEIVARLRKRAQEQGRADDTEEAIRHRPQIYLRETAPLLDVYRDRGLVDRGRRHSARSTRSPSASSPRSRPRGLDPLGRGLTSVALPPLDLQVARPAAGDGASPGSITAAALDAARALIAPGVTTRELDAAGRSAVITARGAKSNFKLERGYHHTICASVNEQVVHGIPGDRVLSRATSSRSTPARSYEGWNGDSAFTLVLPDPARPDVVAERQRLSDVTEGSLWAGIAALATASHLDEVGDGRAGLHRRQCAEGGYGILTRLRRARHRPQDARGAVGLQLPRARPGARGAARPGASRSSRWSSSATRRPSSRTTAGPSSTDRRLGRLPLGT